MFKLSQATLFLGLIILTSDSSLAANINAPNTPPTQDITAHGILHAAQKTEIAAPMTGQLLETHFKPGQYFSNQALMASFECAALEAEKNAKIKAHQTLSIKHDIAAELFTFGAAGQFDVSLAHSEMEQVFADVNVIKTRLKNCHVYAPYNGYVTEHHVSAHETAQIGQVLYSIHRAGALELSLTIPAQWTGWLTKEQFFTFAIDETDENFKAKVVRISKAVDPVSQTLEITAKPMGKIRALVGMSGFATFEPPL